ncbi:hypothetical protein [uncultured Brachyspira sp.]|uniref:hypothetical protein n=1 Tax=uncultured Brachyspira sp. TaxID=221953 RepID=UPI002626DF22|nr:hypothetical protein [uncultured Brachyspira sp.]
MEQDKTQLVELFIDCIDKRRFVSQISSKDEYDLQQRKTNEYSFNVNSFYRPKIYYKYMQLGILPKDIRPDFLLFYNNGESSIIEVVNEQSQLKNLFNKYENPEENFFKYLGDYRYILCSNEINIDTVPDTWGILRIDMIDKRKHPHIILIKPALMVKKTGI